MLGDDVPTLDAHIPASQATGHIDLLPCINKQPKQRTGEQVEQQTCC